LEIDLEVITDAMFGHVRDLAARVLALPGAGEGDRNHSPWAPTPLRSTAAAKTITY
jgi:hypothetical protein